MNIRRAMRILAIITAVAVFLATAVFAQNLDVLRPDAPPKTLKAAILRVETLVPLPLSRLDLPAEDAGFAGARLATSDNALTGRFVGQSFETEEISTPPETALAELDALAARGFAFIVVMAPAEILLRLADHAAGRKLLLFNATAPDDRLRGRDCRGNLLHIAPSRAQFADALAQYLVWKKWRRWMLIAGSNPADHLLAAAFRRAAKRFGAKIVEERIYQDTGGARRTDTGHVQVQKQIPVFTQKAKTHDVVVAADESAVFANYLPYRTWNARPVTGSAGLQPTSWGPEHEAWGATQFQRRFERAYQRRAQPTDYQVWLAVRALGEAATRTGSTQFGPVHTYLLGKEFGLAAFKGQKLTFRHWNRQLRQPILLTDGKSIVSVSPQKGFLHPISTLDTLGFDQAESTCPKK